MNSDERLWPEVLEVIYSNGGTVIHSTKMPDAGRWDDESEVVEELCNHSEEDVREAISLLERADLVKEEREDWEGPPDHVFLKLTSRGFEVAHERELKVKQQETNENLAFFTLILGFAAILQTVAAAVQIRKVSTSVGLLLLTLLLTLAIAFYQSQPLRWLRSLFSSIR